MATLGGHGGQIRGVAMSADGRTAVTGSYDDDVRVFREDGGGWALVFTLDDPSIATSHGDIVRSVAMTPNGGVIVSGSKDNTMKVWNGYDGSLIRSHGGFSGEVLGVGICDDGSRVVGGDGGGSIRVYDGYSGAEEAYGALTVAGKVLGVAVDGGCSMIVSGGFSNVVDVFDVVNGGAAKATLSFHSTWVEDVDVSDDGSLIVSSSNDNSVALWQRDEPGGWTWTHVQTLVGHGGSDVRAVAIRGDGARIVSGGHDDRGLRCVCRCVWE